MDSRREHILVLLLMFIVMKYVIVGILAMQKLAIFQQKVQMMVMAVFMAQGWRGDFGRSWWQFERYGGFLEVLQLIALKGEMEPEFERNGKKQGKIFRP